MQRYASLVTNKRKHGDVLEKHFAGFLERLTNLWAVGWEVRFTNRSQHGPPCKHSTDVDRKHNFLGTLYGHCANILAGKSAVDTGWPALKWCIVFEYTIVSKWNPDISSLALQRSQFTYATKRQFLLISVIFGSLSSYEVDLRTRQRFCFKQIMKVQNSVLAKENEIVKAQNEEMQAELKLERLSDEQISLIEYVFVRDARIALPSSSCAQLSK